MTDVLLTCLQDTHIIIRQVKYKIRLRFIACLCYLSVDSTRRSECLDERWRHYHRLRSVHSSTENGVRHQRESSRHVELRDSLVGVGDA